MVRTYIPGFTNSLEPLDAPEYFGGPAYVDLPPEEVVPSAPPIMLDQYAQPAAPATMAPPLEQPFTAPQFSDLFPNGIDQETLAAMLSTAPGAVVSPAASQPGPGAGLVTTPGGEQGFYFYTDKGRLAGYDGKGGFIAADPNAQYRMYDERGKNRIVAEGTGVEALQNIYNIANQFNEEQGKKANWGIERLNPATGQWERISENDPAKNIGGKIADIALPTIGALIAGPLGAAAGSGLSSVAQGRSLEDTLLRAAISGGATYAGGQLLGGAPGGGASGVGGTLGGSLAAAGPAAQAALNATLPGIVVSGALSSAAGSALGSAAGSALGSALTGGAAPASVRPSQPTQPSQPQQPVEITPEGNLVLTGSRIPEVVNPLPFTTAGAGALAQAGYDMLPESIKQQIEQKQAEEEGQITVTGDSLPKVPPVVTSPLTSIPNVALPTNVPQSVLDIARAEAPQEGEIIVTPTAEPNVVPGLVAAATAPLAPSPTAPPAEGNIVVTGEKAGQFDFPDELAAVPPLAAIPTIVGGPLGGYKMPPAPEEKSFLDKLKENLGVTDYMRLAALGLGLVGGGGGGDRGALATIPRGMFGGSGVFGGRLPAATLPGVSTGFAPRTADDLAAKTSQDWYRYGYGPEQSFFSYVPKGEPNTSRAYTGYEQAQADEDKGFAVGGMAGGGMRGPGNTSNSYAVNGPGTGRSDEIPALLSDGEYVIDAETVALLGDGSSKAGAERLDQLRVKIRKDKGRKLAKGEFSVNAKRPEHYLKGGRA